MRSRGVAKGACILSSSALFFYAVLYVTMFLRNPTPPDLLPRLERAGEHAILEKLEGLERQIDQIGEFLHAHGISVERVRRVFLHVGVFCT